MLYIEANGGEVLQSMKFRWIFLAITAVVAFGLLASVIAGESSNGARLPALFIVPFITLGGLGAYALRRNRERRTGSGAKDGVEISRAHQAQAGVFFDAVLGALTVGTLLLITEATVSAYAVLMVFGVALVGDFWVRYLILRQRDGS